VNVQFSGANRGAGVGGGSTTTRLAFLFEEVDIHPAIFDNVPSRVTGISTTPLRKKK